MNDKLAKSNNNFDNNGNEIIEEIADGSGKVRTIKYGLIKLMGEKDEYRVSYKTLLDIVRVKDSKFGGYINIPELNMKVHTSQIIKMRGELEKVRYENNFTNLPTEGLYLDLNFKPINKNLKAIEREYDEYYYAECHYMTVNGERQYYLDKNQIKHLVLMKRDTENEGYPHYGTKPLRYGADEWKVYEELAKRKLK